MSVNKDALIIGGGLAGMTAALDRPGRVQRRDCRETGGTRRHVRHVCTTLSGKETGPRLAALIEKTGKHPQIKTYLNARIGSVSGYVGNFTTELTAPAVTIKHGVSSWRPARTSASPRSMLTEGQTIITQRDFETMLHDGGQQPTVGKLKSIVMIQCVGSPDGEHDYCSRVCCSHALKNAIAVKTVNPKIAVYVLFRDIRSYGLREKYYGRRAKWGWCSSVNDLDANRKCRSGQRSQGHGQRRDPRETVALKPDCWSSAPASLRTRTTKGCRSFSRCHSNPTVLPGAHVKLRPVDFATDGIFVAACPLPEDIGETIAQARAAAGRAATVLSKESLESEGKISSVRTELCSGCGTCVAVCAYNAIELDPVKNVAVVNETLCKGCGACAASCRANAVDLNGFRNEQILSVLSTIQELWN